MAQGYDPKADLVMRARYLSDGKFHPMSQYKTTLFESAAEIERLRADLAGQDNFILKFTDKDRNGDWACVQCKPHSDMIQVGFACGYHRAEARNMRGQLSEENRGPLHYPERPLSCASDKTKEAEAAYALAEFFATTVIRKLEQGYKDLYCWEQRALDWLKEWRKRDHDAPLNAWTQTYLNHGPPPWRSDQN